MSEIIEEFKDEAADKVDQSKEALLDGAEQAKTALEQTKGYVEANPVPIIVGALAVGFVLGLLVPREKETPSSLVDGKLDELKDLVGSLRNRLSTKAEDGYSDVSSALGTALKNAKKRFNIS